MLFKKVIGTGEDLVLLHGWGFNHQIFAPLVEVLEKKYRLTFIDLPGHGQSSVIDGGISQWANSIIKLMPAQPILLGWSIGGLIAQQIALKVKIKKLYLVASTPNFVNNINWDYGIKAQVFDDFNNLLNHDVQKTLVRFLNLQTTDKQKIRTLKKIIKHNPAHLSALNQGLQILKTTDLSKNIGQIQAPIIAILGARDTLVPIKIKQWYAGQKIQVKELKTGHMPFLHPDFISLLTED